MMNENNISDIADEITEVIASQTDLKQQQVMKDHYEILKRHQETYSDLCDKYTRNLIKPSNIALTYFLNVVDPINFGNNLGKSISNYHNRRIKRILAVQKQKFEA